MKNVLKTICLFIGFVILLSIKISDQPIFSYIYSAISPMTTASQNAVENFMKRSLSSTKNYSVKIFDNSVPKFKDAVNSKLSSTKVTSENIEKITEEDKLQLDELIRDH